MLRQTAVLALVALVLLARSLDAEPVDVPQPIARAMQDRNFAKAIQEIDNAVEDPAANKPYLLYLKGRAQHYLEQYQTATETFDQFEKQFGDHALARRVRFAKAVSLVRKGDYEAAETIYRKEAEFLLSVARKQEIAEIYLEFANAYYRPADENKKPDYKKAIDFFSKALEVGPKADQREEVELRIGLSFQKLGDHKQAAQRFAQFVKSYSESKRDIEARFQLGESQLAMNQAANARQTWEDLLARHGESASGRIAEATFNLARTFGTPPSTTTALDLAIARYQAFLKSFPEHPLASRAWQAIGVSQMNHRRFDDAAKTFTTYLEDEQYADREETPGIRFQLGVALQSQKKYAEAIAAWQDYLAKHPAHSNWASAQKAIVDTDYLKALDAQQARKFEEARTLYLSFLVKYPLDNRVSGTFLLLGQMNFEQENWEAALADWRRTVARFPGTEEASKAQFMIGTVLEKKLHKFEQALDEYKKLTWGSRQGQAKQRIALLQAKQLTIRTERVFRTDEVPQIRVAARNVEKLNVRAYRIDLETYFRKVHLANGVEQLDISLIEPDHISEFEIPRFTKYKREEHAVPLDMKPVAGPNAKKNAPAKKNRKNKQDAKNQDSAGDVLVVTVSGGDLEATTMVLQSDLDIVVKSSRDEVFVFAQDMRTGKPWPGAQLLISNGSQVFAEVKTGVDGVYQGSFPELASTNDVRVFAIDRGNTASNVIGLQGVGVAKGLTDRGYLYTDRPAYRPGGLVNVRGLVRKVSADTYTIETGKKFDMTVLDNRGRQVWTEPVTLNEFGSFHARFTLPSTSPVGQYRIQITDKDKQTYAGTFVVHDYKLENIQLTIDSPRTVYYRGEVIEGTIRANYYYGSPVVGREVRYRLSDGTVQTAITDVKGEVAFKHDTREFHETHSLRLIADLPGFAVQAGKEYIIATQGFSLSLTTVRPVYLAGESLEVTVAAADAEGKPAGRKLRLQVFEQTSINGSQGERLVSEQPIETDAKSGKTNVSLVLKDGGRYILRAAGTDRFENPVTGEHTLDISGDNDSVRLRLLADRHSYKVGETAKVRIHWREEPALALITFQGARILQYELLPLKKGSNELNIPLDATLAPNFDLDVSVMTDARSKNDGSLPQRFHQASSPFTVQRELLVRVEPVAKGAVRPGQEIEVKITTTDPQGRPVGAEVSLAMIEKSLLDRFAFNQPAVANFFRGSRRQSAVRTLSSISFNYTPVTTGVNKELLAEHRRELERLADKDRNGNGINGVDFYYRFSRDGQQLQRMQPGQAAMNFDSTTVLSDEIRQKQRLLEEQGKATPGRTLQFFGRPSRRTARESESTSGYFGLRRGSGSVTDVDGTWGMNGDAMLGDIVAAFPNGNVERYDSGAFRARDFRELAERVAAAGGVIMPAVIWQETGYWNPAIVTDEKGVAQVKLTVPERSTAWKLLGKGITTKTLAGESDAEIISRQDLFGELKLPQVFTDGDTATLTATIHNTAIKNGEIKVTLKSTIAGKTATQTRSVAVQDAKDGSTHQLSFDVHIARPDDVDDRGDVQARFELLVESGESQDRFARSVPIRPFGLSVTASASGTASADTATWVEFPENVVAESPRLEITLGPSIESGLLDIVFGGQATDVASPLSESVAGDLMAALSLQSLIQKTRDAGHPSAERLDRRIRSAISSLVSVQLDDGAWGWCSASGNRYVSARSLWALSMAKKAGYVVPEQALANAIQFVQAEIAKTSNADYESKAVLLHALVVAGKDDFPLANRLYRNRPSLSTSALLYLALALAESDRQPVAAELLDLAADRKFDEAQPLREASGSSLPWNHAPAELRALFALALQLTRPDDPRIKQSVDWLMEHRIRHRWSPAKATGPASAAVCQWYRRTKFQNQNYGIKIFVNDEQVADLKVDGASATRTLPVPARFLKRGKQRVSFELTGRGTYSYQCLLEGFVPADRLASSTEAWRIERKYEPAQLERDGRAIPRGFNIVRSSYTAFTNPLTQLPVARRGQVSLRLWRNNVGSGTSDEHLEYLVVTEPLPAGVTVVEGSVTGDFARFEETAGTLTFFIQQGTRYGNIRYDVYGYLPGKYNAAPTVVRDVYRPERFAVHEPKSLAVLPLGEKSGDEYRLTPNELHALGKRAFDRQEWAECVAFLSQLTDGTWTLEAKTARDITHMLLDAHLEVGPAQKVVHYFEVIKEKWPQMEMSYAKILKIGSAYESIGEFERAYLVFRATVESSFLTESRVVGFLQTQEELLRSVNVMDELLLQYPPESYVANAEFDLAQQVFGMADKAEANAHLRERKIKHDDLVRGAIHRLDNFLTAYSTDPAADQAAFSLATGQLELRDYEEAIAHCSRCVERYVDSHDVDNFWYTIGFCQFALSRHRDALETCRKVAEMKRRDPDSGLLVYATNRLEAIYILGQIYHSLGQAAKAIGEYERVKDNFADAVEAIDFFTRRDVRLPEVSMIAPGEPVAIELKHRNITQAVVKVYKIDLMKFGLLKRNLKGITNINLAGIRPFHEAEIALGDGKDYADRTRELKLPIEDEGAWLVVCRGDDLHTSGLVLISPLSVEIQEDAGSGRLRTTVKDLVKDAYVSDVHVKVIGSENDEFVSGETDLRGVFVADRIRGTSTVIAQAQPGRYAFHRGETHLGPRAVPAAQNKNDSDAVPQAPATSGKAILLDNLFRRNGRIQQSNSARQLEQIYNDEAGVKAEAVAP